MLITAFLLYWYLTRTHGYWAERGIPGPRPLPGFGTYAGQFLYSFHISEEERLQNYGAIYGIYEGRKPGLIVGDPNLIKDIMIQDSAIFYNRRPVKTTHPVMSNFLSSLENEPWKRVRGLIRKTFKPRELRSIFHLFADSAVPMMDDLARSATTGWNIDLKSLFGAYTMDVISRSCFAAIPDAEFVRNASSLFTFPFWRKFLDYVMPMWLLDSLGFTVLPKAGMDFFRSRTVALITDRLENPVNRFNDFLQLLIEAESSVKFDEIKFRDGGSPTIVNSATHRKTTKLSHDEILSQSVLFFSVGYETSSQLLTYCAYCLALNPDIQDQLRDEITRVLTETNRLDSTAINPEDLDASDYLAAVIAETLRLYNPVLRMERAANADYVLRHEGREILVEKDTIIGIPVWALHHSAQHYPEPDRFDPGRFTGEDEDGWKRRARTKFACVTPVPFLPFGVGPRNCIGTRFAIMETKLALMKILPKYRFVQTAGTKVPLKFFPTGRPLLGCDKVLVGVEKVE